MQVRLLNQTGLQAFEMSQKSNYLKAQDQELCRGNDFGHFRHN